MKPILLLVAMTLLLVTACGSSDTQACRDYCSKMANTTDEACFGDWLCLTIDIRDNFNLCGERQIFSYEGDGKTEYACYRPDGEYAGRSSLPEGVDLPESARESRVSNPKDEQNCLAICDVNTQGDSMPEEFEAALAGVDSCHSTSTSLLQMLLNQQCRVEATEK